MRHGTRRTGLAQRGAVLAVAVALVLSVSPGPLFAQAETATIEGALVDPDGNPAVGSRVVMRDLATGKTFTSSPVAADGRYTIPLPTGARYALDEVIAPDGSKVPVEGQVPLRVSTPGTYRMDVRLVAPAEAAAAPPVDRTAPQPVATAGSGTAKPWYKRPGAIVAIVVGTVGLAVAASGDDDNRTASPSSQ